MSEALSKLKDDIATLSSEVIPYIAELQNRLAAAEAAARTPTPEMVEQLRTLQNVSDDVNDELVAMDEQVRDLLGRFRDTARGDYGTKTDDPTEVTTGDTAFRTAPPSFSAAPTMGNDQLAAGPRD